MPTLATLPLFDRLAPARRVLVAGAGGGFDVFAGIPVAEYLRAREPATQVFFANLSFAYLGGTSARLIAPHLYEVRATTTGEERYFPELCLAHYLATRDLDDRVFAFEKTGVDPLRASYEELVRLLDIDTIVLVDGGTDILMRGDEAGLGTPEEDMASLAAVSGLSVRDRLLLCLGFGVDAYHGVCHAQFLENVAALSTRDAFLGAFTVLANTPEGQAFLAAVDLARHRTPSRQSIVNGSIAAAVRGGFGDVPVTDRIAGSELFINPLMSLYFAFDLAAVAARHLYLPALEGTQSIFEVAARIEAFRHGVTARPRQIIPHLGAAALRRCGATAFLSGGGCYAHRMPRTLSLPLGLLLSIGACGDTTTPAPAAGQAALGTYRDGCDEAACGAEPVPAHGCVGGYAVSVCTKARGACGWQVDCASEPPPGYDPNGSVGTCDTAQPGGPSTCGEVPAYDEKDCVWGFLGEPSCERLNNAPCAWSRRCRPEPCDRTGTCNTLDRSKVGAACGHGESCPTGTTCASIGVNLGEYVEPSCITGNPCVALTCAAGRRCAVLESYPAQVVCGK